MPSIQGDLNHPDNQRGWVLVVGLSHTGHADHPGDGTDENNTAGGKNGRCNAGYEPVFPGG